MRELATDGRVMLFEHVTPGGVAQRCRSLRRTDDVGEKNGREHSIRLQCRADASEKLLDLVENVLLIAGPGQVIDAGELDELRTGNALRDIAALPNICVQVAGAVEDERRDADRRQNLPNVDLRVHLRERKGRPRARGEPEISGELLLECHV